MATFVEVPQADGSIRHKAVVRRKGHKAQAKTFKRKIDATKWARKVESDIDDGGFVASKELVKTLFAKYRDEVTANKDEWRSEAARINRLLGEKWAELPVSDCGDAIHFWSLERRKKVTNATVNRELNTISGIFTYARKKWRIRMRENPVKLVDRPPKGKARRRRVRPEELAAIWTINRNATRRGKPTIAFYIPVMFEFAIETALREKELCHLRWCDVHLEAKWLYVLPSKNGDDRQVPMSQRAIDLIKDLPRSSEQVFPVNRGSLETSYRKYAKQLKLVDLHFHDTRHEAVSRLAKVYPILQLAAIIGHRDLKSLQVYYNPTIEELAQYLHGDVQPKPLHP